MWGPHRVLAVGWEGRRWFSRAGGLGAAPCGTSGECGLGSQPPGSKVMHYLTALSVCGLVSKSAHGLMDVKSLVGPQGFVGVG